MPTKTNLNSIFNKRKKMKKLAFLFFMLSLSSFLFSQENNQINVKGQIIVEGNDIEGIVIFNKMSNKGTVSDTKGEFKLKLKLSDTIEFRALKYQDFNVVVNAAIIQSKRMKIFLIEEINQLDEIVISDSRLSGNLITDVSSVQTFKPKYEAIYFGVKQERRLNESESDFTRSDIAITNITSQNKPLVNGLNIINVVDQLLIPLFRSEVRNKKELGVPDVPAKSIKYFLGSEFLLDNFGIPRHRIEEFIRYVEEENFDFNLLNYGKELELLEVINQKSKLFLKDENKKTD
tara:strand:+ start:23204 stop:24073 length:870 start_codon:yes stop_codon:yes gene_type:complete